SDPPAPPAERLDRPACRAPRVALDEVTGDVAGAALIRADALASIRLPRPGHGRATGAWAGSGDLPRGRRRRARRRHGRRRRGRRWRGRRARGPGWDAGAL